MQTPQLKTIPSKIPFQVKLQREKQFTREDETFLTYTMKKLDYNDDEILEKIKWRLVKSGQWTMDK
jgi:hypothetical protein